MKLAVASGKGGTGKTSVSVNLAVAVAEEERTTLVDCDVEAPNAHLYLHPEIDERWTVSKAVPVVDELRCTHCTACVSACEYHAIAFMAEHALVFDELCHGCGRCSLVCPSGAITERDHPLGVIERGAARALAFAQGRLHIGEAMASPIIRRLKRSVPETTWTIFDSPPGTGCPVITTLHGADVAVLVTEPTPFGLHDLRAAVGVVRSLGIPAGVVINRDGIGDRQVDAYCNAQGLPVLLRIPFDRAIAEIGAEAWVLIEEEPEWRAKFLDLADRIRELIR
jgi:MinD superfamily P-loop ATPase